MVCLTLFVAIFSGFAKAYERANLQIVGTPSYYLYKEEVHPTKFYYKINVTFYNSGDEPSDQINIQLFEDGHPTVSPPEYQGVSLDSHKYENFTFDWSTPLTYKTVDIVYKPSSANIPETGYNSGNKTIEVSSKSMSENKTPGFEFSLVIMILSIIICLKYFTIKKYN